MPIHPSLPQQMMGAFTFDGKRAVDFGLVCKSVKRPVLPAPKLRMVEIGGRSGAYALPTVAYETREISVKIQYVGTEQYSSTSNVFTVQPVSDPSFFEVRTRARKVAEWLSKENWCELAFDDEPDKTYQATIANDFDLELMELYPFGIIDLTFTCQPYAYGPIIETGGVPSIYYEGNVPINKFSPPSAIFVLTNGDGSLSMNGITIYHEKGAQFTVDNINCDTIPRTDFKYLRGDIDKFFTLLPGINYIGSSTAIKYRPMWY